MRELLLIIDVLAGNLKSAHSLIKSMLRYINTKPPISLRLGLSYSSKWTYRRLEPDF